MLDFTDVSLRRGIKVLLDHTSFRIHSGHKAGVTGANGVGKSSLFSLVLGDLHADTGDCSFPRDWVIAHVAQESLADSRPAIEYVLDGDRTLRETERLLAHAEAENHGTRLAELHVRLDAIDAYTAKSRAGSLMHGLGFTSADEEKGVNEFSGGWRMRLNLAQTLMCRSDLLLLDEPTNHLDLDAVIWLEGWLRAYQGTLLLISHDRDFLDNVAEHIVHIEHQTTTLYRGNYTAFERIRAERLANQQATYEQQQREVAHMQSFVERFRAKATKARQAQSRLKALERMELIAPAHVDSPFHFSFPNPEKTPNPLVRLDDASVGYGETPTLTNINFSIAPGDRIGLLGANGAGKSTLIKLLAGDLSHMDGKCQNAKDLTIGYFAQHQVEQLHGNSSPIEHLQRLAPLENLQVLRNFLGGFGFSNEQALMPTETFSGGEKSRLVLAMLAWTRPNLLLLDEPTNHLDIEMRQALAQALQEYTGAMVIVSHDRHLLRVTTDELLLVHDGSVERFPESLDEYPAWLSEQNRKPSVSSPSSSTGTTASDDKDRKRREAEYRQRLAPLRKQISSLEKKLASLTDQQEKLGQELSESELYEESNKERLKALIINKAVIDKNIEDTEYEWMMASEALENA